MVDQHSARARRWKFTLGASIVAMGTADASSASAQCTPDPTTANGTTTCTGTDSDGLAVSTPNSTVVVAKGATVRPGNAPAAINVTATSDYLTINGLVDGEGKPAIAITAGAPVTVPCDPYSGASVGYCLPGSTQTSYPSASATIAIAAGATVTGSQALLLSRDINNANGFVNVTLTNAGTMTGTAGPAVVDSNANNSYLRVTNQAGGSIAGMSGSITSVINAGTIDGGANAAIATTVEGANIANSGRIASSGTPATVSGSGFLYVTNAAGATLGGSATAINVGGALQLTNAGTINGSVTSSAGTGQNSVVDTRTGTINGDLTLGAGYDTLRAAFDTVTGRVSSITGAIDGGAGTDTLAIGIDRNATVGAVPLPKNFELLGLDLSNNAIVTLAPSFNATGGAALSGYGSVVNQANLMTSGPTVLANATGYPLSFTNQATITATLSSGQVAVGTPISLTNSGTITAQGGAGVQAGSSLTNSGTITATGTAAAVSYGTVANTGAIRSTADTGLSLTGTSYYSSSTNSGTIRGATTGAVVSSARLTNTGSITGDITGVALGFSGTLVNAAGGTVSGGSTGVTNAGQAARVVNAGTINGGVNLATDTTYDSSADIFVDADGIVNGAIRLGGGDDQLVVDLATDPNRLLAGATGGVDAGAGYDTLRYRVDADASATLALANGFEGLAYELDNHAQLELTAPAPITTTIGLTGNGTVTLNGAISTTDRSLVDATISTVDQLTAGTPEPAQDLTIVNNGSVGLKMTQIYSYTLLAASYAGNAEVTNNGTIAVSNAAGAYYPASAVFGGRTVTNAGAITLIGGTGINNAQTVVNSGTIADTAGSGGYGVTGVTTLTNSGTIRVDRNAVATSYAAATVTNSGTIESRLSTGVVLGYGSTLVNEAAGTVTGATAVSLSGGTVINRGTITGALAGGSVYSSGSNTFVTDGGTVTGDVTLAAGDDSFIVMGAGGTGVSGTVDGGAGTDTFGHVLTASGTVSLDGDANVVNFENAFVQAQGAATVATLTATNPFAGTLYVSGDGTVANGATLLGTVQSGLPYGGGPLGLPTYNGALASFSNTGSIAGGLTGSIGSFSNAGSIGTATQRYAVQLVDDGALAFANSGQVAAGVSLIGTDAVSIDNSGAIAGVVYTQASLGSTAGAGVASVTNNGSIAGKTGPALVLGVATGDAGGSVSVINTGTLSAATMAGYAGVQLTARGTGATGFTIANSGTIAGTLAAGSTATGALGLYINGSGTATTTVISNAAGGTISGGGTSGTGLFASGAAVTLDNTGTISGGTVATDSSFKGAAISLRGTFNQTVRNTGTIAGAVLLEAGNDRVENGGTISGPVRLGAGDDVFVLRDGAMPGGLVDGGDGTDLFLVDLSEKLSVSASQLTNFEALTQTGTGTGTYSGRFGVNTISLMGGGLAVAEGQTLATTGPTSVTGGDASLSVTNAGTISGNVVLGSGADRVTNNGTIGGAVRFSGGDDVFTEGAGSGVAGGVDGGDGIDLYRVVLAGDRTGIGARTGFEQLAVDGTGTLTLALDQNFQSVALSGTNLAARLGGFTLGWVDGSDAAEQVVVDGDVAAVALGGGNDQLTLGTATAAGRYDGGTGIDTLAFTAPGPVTLTGAATGFENVSLAGGALSVTGALGSTVTPLSFGDGAQSLAVANGGTLAGTIDLGAGDDQFRLAAGGMLAGTVSGGAGIDTATLELSTAKTFGGALTGFERLVTEGSGALTLANEAFAFDRVEAAGDLTVSAGASLAAPQLVFGAADNHLTIAGGFAGSVVGGAGNDSIDVSGGGATTPVAFGSITDVEALRMSAGLAIISGTATLGNVALSGGRLIGLGGSTIAAPTIGVGQGATFGSAGTVIGNLSVAGTLSPGASPGTMTVNGNVALAGSSVSLFEITPTVSDKLIVNGSLSIASGATLQLIATQALMPGQSLTLVTASGGITGSYTNIVKSASLFGFVVQQTDSIRLLGQFLNDASYSAQAGRSIDYINGVLTSGQATAALLSAAPALASASGTSDQAAFARLTPEAYASAEQIGVEQGLALADAGRSDAFAAHRDTPGLFTFASALAGERTLERGTQGTSSAQTNGYGFLGGIGVAGDSWSLGAFGGYLNSRQDLAMRGARTRDDGFVAGVHGRWKGGGLGVKATAAYDGGNATTRRLLPGGTAESDYALHGWTGDISADYAVALGGNWSLRPSLGATAIRVTRDAVAETGGSAFVLDVARDHLRAVFVDGAVTFRGAIGNGAAVRPFLSVGLRYQVDGRLPYALAALGGGGYGLLAAGASRAPVLATATIGSDVALSPRLALFGALSGESGDADHRASARTGLKLTF